MATSPNFAIAVVLSGSGGREGQRRRERGVVRAPRREGGHRLPVPRARQQVQRAAQLRRAGARAARSLLAPSPSGPAPGWASGSLARALRTPGKCAPAVKGEPAKLGFVLPIGDWGPDGVWQGRFPRVQTKRKLRTQALTFLSCGGICCILKGIYRILVLGQAVRFRRAPLCLFSGFVCPVNA